MQSAISRIAIVLLTVAMCFGGKKRSGVEALVDKVILEAGGNAGELREFLSRYYDERRAAAEYSVAAVWGASATTGPGMDSIEALYHEKIFMCTLFLCLISLPTVRKATKMPVNFSI